MAEAGLYGKAGPGPFREAITLAISDWPVEERPRERLLQRGAHTLSDSELLAVLLRTGTRGRSAVDMARDLLLAAGSLPAVLQAQPETLPKIPGLGPAKLAPLFATIELARRCLRTQASDRSAMGSPAAVRDYLRLHLGQRDREVFMAIWLDAQHRVISSDELFQGTLTQTSVYPREVVRAGLRANAAAVILSHNHPSGVAEPSQADELLTRNLKAALALVDIRVLDHFIVAGPHSLSFAERGLI